MPEVGNESGIEILIVFSRKEDKPMNKTTAIGGRRHELRALLVLAVLLPLLWSCADEPQLVTIYYTTVKTRVGSDVDYIPKSELVWRATDMICGAIKAAYPNPTLQGDDLKVVTACNEAYRDFLELYPDALRYGYCVIKLYKARTVDGVIKESEFIAAFSA